MKPRTQYQTLLKILINMYARDPNILRGGGWGIIVHLQVLLHRNLKPPWFQKTKEMGNGICSLFYFFIKIVRKWVFSWFFFWFYYQYWYIFFTWQINGMLFPIVNFWDQTKKSANNNKIRVYQPIFSYHMWSRASATFK